MANEQEHKQKDTVQSDYMLMDWGGTQPSLGLQEVTQEQISDVYNEGTIDQALEESEEEQ
ncbi:DUF4025 domain-containing protein [Brevibacillus fluminis]|uniref:DUF4025 domain-containing protein n=1 Tax=Brevibacillus fluminis TaxID=511487 RepID=UPI003F8C1A85